MNGNVQKTKDFDKRRTNILYILANLIAAYYEQWTMLL